jgi:hypothetical protein
MPKPSEGGGAPTGNALTDASTNAAIAKSTAQVVQAVNAMAAATQQTSDCLWPPPQMFGLGQGFLGGLLSVTFSTPCLFTRSQARAIMGGAIMVAGLLVMWGGFEILEVREALKLAVIVAGIKGGGKAGKAAAPAAAEAPAASDVTLAA